MRNHELFTGIDVKDKDGQIIGTSKIAARNASAMFKSVKRGKTCEGIMLLYCMVFSL